MGDCMQHFTVPASNATAISPILLATLLSCKRFSLGPVYQLLTRCKGMFGWLNSREFDGNGMANSVDQIPHGTVGINALSGELPRELGRLTDLRSLAFGTNNFSGSLPSEIGNLRRLEQLKLIRNPNTYSSLIGLTWSLVSFKWNVVMPAIVAKSIAILSDAGLGMAMFSLGLFMALQPKIIACGNSVATFAMAVRFLTRPAVMAAASIAVGLQGTLLHVAIVQAALPQGIVPFVFAKEYNVHPDILSTGNTDAMELIKRRALQRGRHQLRRSGFQSRHQMR
ncbi:hypothetical protein OSB04_023717, partial [Centaurea solstitialis]